MEFTLDKSNGYMYCYNPRHPCANAAGKVMEHVYVMYNHIGRLLQPYECVHHIDRNRSNNHISNLQLMTQQEHALLHAIEDRGYTPRYDKCYVCGVTFQQKYTRDKKTCSIACNNKARAKLTISKDELQKLVWEMPTSKLKDILGTSDVAIAKYCKKLGISKPPRGYWRQKETGKI